MILFDGTNKSTIEKSLASSLSLELNDFLDLCTEYFCMNASHFFDISLHGFWEYWNKYETHIKISEIIFSKVIFFHKTSVIDDGNFIRKHGLMPLSQIIYYSSPLQDYLARRGIEFFIKGDVPWINQNGVENVVHKNDNATIFEERAENTIYNRLQNLEDVGIGGYFLLNLALNDRDYDHIKNQSEFMYFLDQWLSGISEDWEKNSKPCIVKSIVDINWVDMINDSSQQLTSSEKSLRIAEDGFLSIADFWAEEIFKTTYHLATTWYYPFIHKSITIPPENIVEILEY